MRAHDQIDQYTGNNHNFRNRSGVTSGNTDHNSKYPCGHFVNTVPYANQVTRFCECDKTKFKHYSAKKQDHYCFRKFHQRK